MSELEPLSLQDVPAVSRVNINDLLYQTPLSSETADSVNDAVDKADALAEEMVDLLDDVQRVADNMDNDMSLAQYKEIEGYLDQLCDLRDATLAQLSAVEDGARQFETLIEGESSRELTEAGETALADIENSAGDINDLYDVANANISAISRYIDQ